VTRLIRLLIGLTAFGGLLALGLYLGERVQADPGYVLFAYAGTTVEMSLWTFVLVFIAVSVVLWVLFGLAQILGQAPFKAWRVIGRAQHRRADGRLIEGALWLRRDAPERALAVLKKDSDTETLPALHWLLASEAARRNADHAVSETYLAKAEQLMPHVPNPLPVERPPTEFKALVKSLKKHWREDWALLLESVGSEDALTRLSRLIPLTQHIQASVSLEIVQARLAMRASLEAEAAHHIMQAKALDAENPLVMLLEIEQAAGSSDALEQLRAHYVPDFA
jgi:uncharacterized protein HemY